MKTTRKKLKKFIREALDDINKIDYSTKIADLSLNKYTTDEKERAFDKIRYKKEAILMIIYNKSKKDVIDLLTPDFGKNVFKKENEILEMISDIIYGAIGALSKSTKVDRDDIESILCGSEDDFSSKYAADEDPVYRTAKEILSNIASDEENIVVVPYKGIKYITYIDTREELRESININDIEAWRKERIAELTFEIRANRQTNRQKAIESLEEREKIKAMSPFEIAKLMNDDKKFSGAIQDFSSFSGGEFNWFDEQAPSAINSLALFLGIDFIESMLSSYEIKAGEAQISVKDNMGNEIGKMRVPYDINNNYTNYLARLILDLQDEVYDAFYSMPINEFIACLYVYADINDYDLSDYPPYEYEDIIASSLKNSSSSQISNTYDALLQEGYNRWAEALKPYLSSGLRLV